MTVHDGRHAWLRLSSGRRLDLLHPDPWVWTDEDLAVGLSRSWRWGGHSRWPLPMSVAQHSLLALAIRERQGRAPAPVRALRTLLHGAEAGLLGGLVPPLPASSLGAPFAAVVHGLRAAIARRYQLPAWDAEDQATHEHAARLATASEAVHVAGYAREEVRDELGITLAPLADDPLRLSSVLLRADARPWQPWPSTLAARRFLGRLEELSEQAERDRTVIALAAAFARLPTRERARCGQPVLGSPLLDTLVRVDAADGSGGFTGVVVGGERDGDGGWALDGELLVFTTDGAPEGALFTVQGAICDVDVL